MITVKVNGIITKTVNTLSKSDFKLVFDYGKVYDVYFQYQKSPVMYMQIIANTIPKEYYFYLMGYELNVPFVYKWDEDIDTTVFKDPFFKIAYDGNKSMMADTAYNNKFQTQLVRDYSVETIENVNEYATNSKSILAGYLQLKTTTLLPVAGETISLLGGNNEILRTLKTSKDGKFVCTGITLSQLKKIRFNNSDSTKIQSIQVLDAKSKLVCSANSQPGTTELALKSTEVNQLIDNRFTYRIGGKLVSASAKEKKFYAEKSVYLLNKHNTILKRTTTNLFGTFVFENIRPDNSYCIAIGKEGLLKGEKIDLLSKSDVYLGTLDSVVAGKLANCFISDNNNKFYSLAIEEKDLKMDIKATIFGDNINQPIGQLKIILLNDDYEVIDSAITDDFGTFKFKYLPFLKRFFLSAENTDNVLDVFKNILIYSEEDNLIKIMTHQKGHKFSYKPVNAEISSLRAIELEDPWLEYVGAQENETKDIPGVSKGNKLIVENILFEPGKAEITDDAKEILDKVILVLNANKNLKIEVGAHTDSKGSAEDNLILSELRAKMVVSYINKSSIGMDRISAKGYGESQILNHCKDDVPCTEKEHAQNRRIEFKILEDK